MATEDTKTSETTTDAPQAEGEGTPETGHGDSALLKGEDRSEAADTEGPDGFDVSDEESDHSPGATVGTAPAGGFAVGAVAVVSAGLGLCSLMGTSLADMLRARKEIIGQIDAASGGGGDQINAFYSAPWHTAALLNGLFAVSAVVIGGVLLAVHARRPDTGTWTKSVALGGVVLGALGLLVAGGMYFDLFAATPELPEAPSAPAPR